MPTVIAHHRVKDVQHWLKSPTRKAFFGPLGVTNIRTFTDPTDPTRVAILMDVPDLAAMQKALGTPAGLAAMQADGVVPESVVVLIES